MAKTKISEFSSTPANNTDIDSINIAEGCAPSGINDAIRELMAQLKDFQTGAQGDSFNGPIGTSTAAAGAFTTLSATGAITSTLATGTAPLVIASTTKVANLNVDLLDGADWASPAALGSTTPAAVSATTLSASGATSLTGSATIFNSSTNTLSLQKSGGAASILFGSNTAATAQITSVASGGLFFSTGDITQTEKLRITAAGDVGIGNSSPSYKLDVTGTLGVSGAVTLSGGTANGVAYLNGSKVVTSGSAFTFDGTNLGVNNGASLTAAGATVLYMDANQTVIRGRVTNGIIFQDSTGTEQMRLTSTGLGIGTTSPSAKLHVKVGTNQNLHVSTDGTTLGLFGVNDAVSAPVSMQIQGLDLRFNTGTGPASERMRLNSDGNLGIGTSSPASKLHVGGSTGQVTTPTAIQMDNTYGTATFDALKFYLFKGASESYGFGLGALAEVQYWAGSSSTGTHVWYTSQTERMRLNASGNLGLGVTPSAWGSGKKVVQVLNSYIGAFTGGAPLLYLGNNHYDNGTNNVYLTTGNNATLYQQSQTGEHRFFTAPSGTAGATITFTQAMTLDASGNLLVGTTSRASSERLTLQTSSGVASFMLATDGATQYYAGADGNSTVFSGSRTNHPYLLYTNGAERARISSAGYFGIGTSNPIVGFQSYAGSGTTGWNWFAGNATNPPAGCTYGALLSTNLSQGNSETNLVWGQGIGAGQYFAIGKWTGSAYTEQMRIDSSGNLLLGTTSTYASAKMSMGFVGSANNGFIINNTNSSGSPVHMAFQLSGTSVGSITCSGSTTAYNTSSDQRLKENIADAESASSLIDSLQVRKFDWKADGSHQRYGFVAQELVTVAPEAVHQPEDSEEMMAVDYSKLVPMLVKEIQSLRKRLADAGL